MWREVKRNPDRKVFTICIIAHYCEFGYLELSPLRGIPFWPHYEDSQLFP